MADRAFDFRILGPLEATLDGKPIALGGPKQQALLALFLLNANQVVPRQRLVAPLQDDQADADRVLRVQVSRLRKALGDGKQGDSRLITQAPGYLLRVEDDELDLDRYRALIRAGRQALERGMPDEAVVDFRQAESLWRGNALAGLESPAFARGEIAYLDEDHLAAVEERVDAELSLGRHARLVSELDALVAEHPFRERLRGQLMLALYRSGRQADALAQYRSLRAALNDDLALEPGSELRKLEGAILRQDEALELASSSEGAGEERAAVLGGNTRRAPVAAALGAIAALSAAALFLLNGGGGAAQLAIEGNALAQLSTEGKPIGSTPLDAAPTKLAFGAGSLWVTHVDAGTVSRVDAVSRTVRQTIRVGRGPFGVAFAGGDAWVANSVDGTVSRVDAETNTVVQTIAVGAQPSAIAARGRAVFVANRGDNTLVRIDAVSGHITSVIETGNDPSDLTLTRDTTWVSNQGDGTVFRIDARSGDRVQTIKVGDGPSSLAASNDGVWVVNSLDATVSRIEPLRGVVTATIAVGGRPMGLAASKHSVWVSDGETGRLLRIDARRNVVVGSVTAGERGGPVVDVESGRWIGVASGGAGHRGGTLRIAGSVEDVRSLDPAVLDAVQPLALLGLTGDGLVTLNHVGGPEGGQLVPDLALGLPSAGDDGRTYVFRLRRGIRFSTGRPVGSRDVRRSFERLFEMRSAGRSLYGAIAGADACLGSSGPCDLSRGIVANDRDHSVTFHLVVPDPDFLHKLALPYVFIVPAGTSTRHGRAPVPGTGPYRVTRFEPGRQIVLERNPYFRLWSSAAQPGGYPDRIVWRLGLSPVSAANLVRTGRADLMSDIGGALTAQIEGLKTRFARQLHINPTMGTDFFFLNTRARPFDDIRVRRALNYALDRNRAVGIYGGSTMARPTCQILPPQMPGFRRYCPYTRNPRNDGQWTAPDLHKARRLIVASGTRGMVVKVWSTPAPAIARDQGRYVTLLLQRLGYRASLHLLPDARFLRYTDNSRNHTQVVSGGWGADYPSASSFIGKLTCRSFIPNSESTFDNSQFCDPQIDREIASAQALQATDRRRSLAAWSRLDRKLTDRAIWLPTVTGTQIDIVSKRAGGYRVHPFWGVLVDQLWVR